MSYEKTFKDRLIEALDLAEMSQSDLARHLKVKPQSVQQWVSGKSEPRGKRAKDIAQALGVEEVWLLTGYGPVYPVAGVQEKPPAYNAKSLDIAARYDRLPAELRSQVDAFLASQERIAQQLVAHPVDERRRELEVAMTEIRKKNKNITKNSKPP